MSSQKINVLNPSSIELGRLVSKHPFINVVKNGISPNGEIPFEPILVWQEGNRVRQIISSETAVENGFAIDPNSFEIPYGVIELMDNNPLVCADIAVMPGNVAALGLLALGPLLKAGLVLESPAIMSNGPCDERELDFALETVGWTQGCVIHEEPLEDAGHVIAIAALCEIEPIESVSQIRELYLEAYSRAFFIKSDNASEWSPVLVQDYPGCVYRVTIEKGETNHLVKILLLANRDHRGSYARAMQYFNVMCGFEEHLPY